MKSSENNIPKEAIMSEAELKKLQHLLYAYSHHNEYVMGKEETPRDQRTVYRGHVEEVLNMLRIDIKG